MGFVRRRPEFLLLPAVLVISALVNASASDSSERERTPEEVSLQARLNEEVKGRWVSGYESLFPQRTEVTDVQIDDQSVSIRFSSFLGRMPIRPETIDRLKEFVRPLLSEKHREKSLRFFVEETSIQGLIPRPLGARFTQRREAAKPAKDLISDWRRAGPPLVRLEDPPFPQPTGGLFGRHLLVSSSHGWMYDAEKSLRWEWQRPRLFTTAEDLHSVSYVVPFLIPMLERAGAVVFYVRERDWQTRESVLDDDDGGRRRPEAGIVRVDRMWRRSPARGFESELDPYPDGFNPHQAGTVRLIPTRSRITAKVEWIPRIPESGEYGVSVSYHASSDRPSDARYTVYHLGGQTTFLVNQKMVGNTWVWLGRFRFREGMRPSEGRVELTNLSREPGSSVCADAVKFGGGMGNVLRGGETSGYPRYAEAARYYLQYAGAPPELTYKRGFSTGYEGPDYVDDYTSRPEWANYLRGEPCGPNENRQHPGLGVPLDLYFSLHTDAAISNGIVGTLAIYRTEDQEGEKVFPDGRSRLLNRELADLVQTQITGDVRTLYTSSWSRRWLWDADYAESRRANVPSCLIELLSHQNFNDMRYGLDPRFRRDVARSMYKGILRFLGREYGYDPIVQPLPPTHPVARQVGSGSAEISWLPQDDPLEPTARPTGYIVYQRIGDGGFDNGTYAAQTRITASGLDPGVVYSYRVEAVNAGGRSLPSETLAVALAEPGTPKALIVSGFDRIGPPSSVNGPGYQGFDRSDRGVGYLFNFGLCGDQYDFDPSSKFVTNDRPGHGASAGDLEDDLELGNTFDCVARHGRAFVECGWSFDSVSDEAVEAGMVNLDDYVVVDWVLGEERSEELPSGFVTSGTPDRMRVMFKTFSSPLQTRVREYLQTGGALLVSGAYVGTDLAGQGENSSPDREFLNDVLHISWVTNHGSNTNDLLPQRGDIFDGLADLHFANGLGEDGVYGVELPDAIDPAKDNGARTVLRYADRRFSAGVVHESTATQARTMILGFPFETIVGSERRTLFLERALEFLHPAREL